MSAAVKAVVLIVLGSDEEEVRDAGQRLHARAVGHVRADRERCRDHGVAQGGGIGARLFKGGGEIGVFQHAQEDVVDADVLVLGGVHCLFGGDEYFFQIPVHGGFLGPGRGLGQGDEMEKILINTSSAVYVPAGLAHFPQIWKNVTRPVMTMVIMPTTGERDLQMIPMEDRLKKTLGS